MLAGPPLVVPLLAYPCWRGKEMILGHLAGAMVILSTALLLIVRESGEVNRLTRQCLDAGYTCWPVPSAFIRYAIYAGIGFAEVVLLFLLSLKFEAHVRNRHYAPEWR